MNLGKCPIYGLCAVKVASGPPLSSEEAGLGVGEAWLDRGALHPTRGRKSKQPQQDWAGEQLGLGS